MWFTYFWYYSYLFRLENVIKSESSVVSEQNTYPEVNFVNLTVIKETKSLLGMSTTSKTTVRTHYRQPHDCNPLSTCVALM